MSKSYTVNIVDITGTMLELELLLKKEGNNSPWSLNCVIGRDQFQTGYDLNKICSGPTCDLYTLNINPLTLWVSEFFIYAMSLCAINHVTPGCGKFRPLNKL